MIMMGVVHVWVSPLRNLFHSLAVLVGDVLLDGPKGKGGRKPQDLEYILQRDVRKYQNNA